MYPVKLLYIAIDIALSSFTAVTNLFSRKLATLVNR